ncbi:MAG: TonB-dependent receptor [Prevotella sp.]|nr:TonB-dependent receptor [Prevotella sp.]
MRKPHFPALVVMGVCLSGSLHAQTKQLPTDSIISTHQLDEVVVATERKKASINSVNSTIGTKAIDKAIGKTLAALLEQVSGISSIQTGTTIAKPVIHGMYGNRILLINNGARLTGQQWGADHAPEIDKNSFQKIEVVKGAESVRYGSEALGGIILMEQKSLPYGLAAPQGHLSAMYGDNGHRYTMAGMGEGALPGIKGVAWRLQATYGNSGDQRTAHYLLNNTGYREANVSTALGYNRGALRAELYYSLFDQKIGVMQSAQMGNENLLQERIRLGRPATVTPYSRAIGYPHQKVMHHTAIFKLFYRTATWGDFEWQTSYQHDNRRENRIRRMNNSDIPTVSLRLQSVQNTLNWNKSRNAWKTEAGVQMLNVENHSERGTGVVPIIPNYTELAVGGYMMQKYAGDHWGGEAGLRADYQHTQADGYDWTGQRYGGRHNFTNFTYSIGGHYRPGARWRLTSNFGMAWRAPHVYELYSNGNELGSGMYVIGNAALKSEHSYKWIASAEYSAPMVCVRLDGYLQWIENYIYDEPTHKNIVVVAGAFPVFAYKQTGAFFRGVDLDVHFAPAATIDYHLVAAAIWTNERSTGNYLPYIPSARLTHSLTWTPHRHGKLQPSVGITHCFVARQNRFDPKTDLISFAPGAYSLLGIEAGLEWQLAGKQSLQIALMGDNILNREYKEYTNRSRYYAHDIGRDIRCMVKWNF